MAGARGYSAPNAAELRFGGALPGLFSSPAAPEEGGVRVWQSGDAARGCGRVQNPMEAAGSLPGCPSVRPSRAALRCWFR